MARQLILRTALIFVVLFALTLITEHYFNYPKVIAGDGRQEVTARQQRVRVIYQLTDVLVRDAQGNFVRGLGPTDFMLKVDGEQVEVKSVDEFEAPSPDDETIVRYIQWAEEAEKKGEEPPVAPTPPRFIVMVFDRFNMGEAALKSSISTAKELVDESLLPYDRVAVFVYNGVLRTLTAPTTDKNRIIAAIEAAEVVSHNHHYRPKATEILPPMDRTGLWDLKSSLMQRQIDFQNYIESMRVLAKSLEALPGRKTYLLFSEGPNLYNPMSPENVASIESLARLTNTEEFGNEVAGYMSPHLVATELSELAKFMSSTNASVYTIRRGQLQPEWMFGVDMDVAGRVAGEFDIHSVISLVTDQMMQQRLDVLRDAARMTKGKFFDAGMSVDKLADNIRGEVGNYYLLGFVPPRGKEGRYHKIEISTSNPDHRIVHREGFFEQKSLANMDKNERAVHMEEGFLLPGVRNELGLEARSYRLPMGSKHQTLMTFKLDPGKIGTTSKGGIELEMVINIEDREGRIRYRSHKIFETTGNVPNQAWFSQHLPAIANGSAVFLAVRDNATGDRSTWRDIYRSQQTPTNAVQLTEPLMLSLDKTGNLASWSSKDVKDGVKTADPLSPVDIEIPGRPMIGNEVEQGGEAVVVLMVGNVPSQLDVSKLKLSVNYALDPREEKSYLLSATDQKVKYLAPQKMLLLSARVPVGLAQQETGQLSIAISGLFGDRVMLSSMPYKIKGFSQSKAAEMLSDSRITELK